MDTSPSARSRPVHLRHHHIGDQQVNVARMLFDQTYRLLRCIGEQTPYTPTFEDHLAEFQIAFSSSTISTVSVPSGVVSAALSTRVSADAGTVARKIDFESRSLPRLAVYVDETFVLPDNAVHRGQTQTGALPYALGGEKGPQTDGPAFPRPLPHPSSLTPSMTYSPGTKSGWPAQ